MIPRTLQASAEAALARRTVRRNLFVPASAPEPEPMGLRRYPGRDRTRPLCHHREWSNRYHPPGAESSGRNPLRRDHPGCRYLGGRRTARCQPEGPIARDMRENGDGPLRRWIDLIFGHPNWPSFGGHSEFSGVWAYQNRAKSPVFRAGRMSNPLPALRGHRVSQFAGDGCNAQCNNAKVKRQADFRLPKRGRLPPS